MHDPHPISTHSLKIPNGYSRSIGSVSILGITVGSKPLHINLLRSRIIGSSSVDLVCTLNLSSARSDVFMASYLLKPCEWRSMFSQPQPGAPGAGSVD